MPWAPVCDPVGVKILGVMGNGYAAGVDADEPQTEIHEIVEQVSQGWEGMGGGWALPRAGRPARSARKAGGMEQGAPLSMSSAPYHKSTIHKTKTAIH